MKENKALVKENKYKKIKSSFLEKIYELFFKENIKKESVFFTFITLIFYMIIICISCYYHEAWEDESQAWLIARDLSPIGIIKQMRFEGHSCMWHFMLFPFAKLGLPFDLIKIISILASLITGYLILTKSPFNRITKIAILFSSTFLYYMPVIVRPYSLIPLLVVIISIMNENKNKYPIAYGVVIAILANIHVLMVPFAGMLFLYGYAIPFFTERKKLNKTEKKRFYIGSIIAVVGILLMCAQAIAGYIFSIVKDVDNTVTKLEMIDIFIKKFVYYLLGVKYIIYSNIIVITTFSIIAIHSIFISRKQGTIFWSTFIFWMIVHIFVWRMILNQRIAMLFIWLVYYAWNYRYDIDYNDLKNKKIYFIFSYAITFLLVLYFLFSIENTYKVIEKEIQEPYCGGKDVAEYIIKNANENSVILTNMSEYLSTVVAYTDGYQFEFYEVLGKRNFTFKNYDKIFKKDKKALDEAIEKYENREKYILFKLEALNLEEYIKKNPEIEQKAELLYQTSGIGNGTFYLWKVK